MVKSWTLRNYKDADGKPLELVNTKGAQKVGYPFTYDFRAQQPSTNVDKALWVPHPSPDGLTLARQHPPDVIFCDLRMPGMDGFAFLERLRSDPELRRSRVIAVSGLASEDDVRRTWQAGFDGHLVKPIIYDGLLAQLKRTLWAHYHAAVPW